MLYHYYMVYMYMYVHVPVTYGPVMEYMHVYMYMYILCCYGNGRFIYCIYTSSMFDIVHIIPIGVYFQISTCYVQKFFCDTCISDIHVYTSWPWFIHVAKLYDTSLDFQAFPNTRPGN